MVENVVTCFGGTRCRSL